jgi:hypothetical protein
MKTVEIYSFESSRESNYSFIGTKNIFRRIGNEKQITKNSSEKTK